MPNWPVRLSFVPALQAFYHKGLTAWSFRSFFIFTLVFSCFRFFCWEFRSKSWFYLIFMYVFLRFSYLLSKSGICNWLRLCLSFTLGQWGLWLDCGFWRFWCWIQSSFFCRTKYHVSAFRWSEFECLYRTELIRTWSSIFRFKFVFFCIPE